MSTQSENSWLKFLNPESLRANLISASLFITSYETLKDSLIEQLRDFYVHAWDETGPIVGEDYKTKVLALDAKQNPLRASIAWLKASKVIDNADERLISELTLHRNEVAHQLPKFIAQAGEEVQVARLGQILDLVTKIDRWWIVNVELAIQDEIEPDKVDESRIISGRMMFLQLLHGIATGAEYTELHKEFAKLSQIQNPEQPRRDSPNVS
jgi:hypothetical protein